MSINKIKRRNVTMFKNRRIRNYSIKDTLLLILPLAIQIFFSLGIPNHSFAQYWQSTFITYDIAGSYNWCAGETRTVSVTVKNRGSQAWINSNPDINIGVKWDEWGDYNVRVDANGLASGNTATYYLPITAPTTTGTNHLTFDVVREVYCWFAWNTGGCGPGNSVLTTSAITIVALPAPQAIGNITVGPVCSANGSALLPDANITASTCYPGNPNSCNLTGGDGHESWRGRLFNSGAGVQAWASTSPFTGSWWQVDLGSVKPVNGVSTQIRGDCCPTQRAASYNVQYSIDGTNWNTIAGGPFTGNTIAGNCAAITNIFSIVYQARYVRILPLTWGDHLSMRADVISIPCGTSQNVTASAELATNNCPTCATVIRWYDAPAGGNLLGSGQYITRTISGNTTIYAEAFNGSVASSRTAVTLKLNPLPTFTTSKTDITCFNAGNGSITITVTGGGSFSYSINNGTSYPYSGASPFTINNLIPGNYNIRVKNSNACESLVCP
jgi:hypothetical protein